MIKLAKVSYDASAFVNFDMYAIEWTGSGPFAIDAIPIKGASHAEAAFMARTFEFGI